MYFKDLKQGEGKLVSWGTAFPELLVGSSHIGQFLAPFKFPDPLLLAALSPLTPAIRKYTYRLLSLSYAPQVYISVLILSRIPIIFSSAFSLSLSLQRNGTFFIAVKETGRGNMAEQATSEEELEYTFTVYEIDLDYEFDAARFFDFEHDESPVEALQAELWFHSAGSYPPSRNFRLFLYLLRFFFLKINAVSIIQFERYSLLKLRLPSLGTKIPWSF